MEHIIWCVERRKFLKTLSATVIGATVAGCMGGTEGNQGTATATGTTTATATDTPIGTETGTQTGTGTGTGMDGDVDLNFRQEGQTPQGIQVTNVTLKRTNNGARVTGTVKNTGNETYGEMEVQVTILDDTDDVLGQFFDNTEEAEFEPPLNPGEKWNFSIDIPRADLGNAASYRIDVDASIDQNVEVKGAGTSTGTTTGTGG